MKNTLRSLILLAASGVSLVATPPQTIYGVVNITDENFAYYYQFGSFDLSNPTGVPGSYTYNWSNLGTSSTNAINNVSRSPLSTQLFAQTGFEMLTPVSTNGTLSTGGPNIPSYFGTTFDSSGNLYGIGGFENTLDILDINDGSVISSQPLPFLAYSQFGGGLAATAGNQLYFANLNTDNGLGELFAIHPGTLVTTSFIGLFSGTDYDANDWMSLFAYDANLYLLNANRLYAVNEINASLTLLGTISGLPVGFERGFAGAVGNVVNSPIPEPSTYGMILAGLALAAATLRRRRVR